MSAAAPAHTGRPLVIDYSPVRCNKTHYYANPLWSRDSDAVRCQRMNVDVMVPCLCACLSVPLRGLWLLPWSPHRAACHQDDILKISSRRTKGPNTEWVDLFAAELQLGERESVCVYVYEKTIEIQELRIFDLYHWMLLEFTLKVRLGNIKS